MTGDDEKRRIFFKGIVVPVDWDANGSVRTIGILTDDEGEYEVEPGAASDQLMEHLRSEILAEGVLLDLPGTVKRARVENFAVLDWRDSDDWVATRRT